MFNATFNNISVISWHSVLLMKETGVSEENHRPAASDLLSYTLYNIKKMYQVQPAMSEIPTQNFSGDKE